MWESKEQNLYEKHDGKNNEATSALYSSFNNNNISYSWFVIIFFCKNYNKYFYFRFNYYSDLHK